MSTARQSELQELAKLIRQKAGTTIFSCSFTKKTNGELRRMVCRLGVKKNILHRGRNFDPTTSGLLGVYDMQAKGHRFINLEGLQELKIRGERFYG